MKLIVKGDDLGWTAGINAGFEKAAEEGILTAAGAMPNMKYFEDGIQRIKNYPHISIGQHTCLVLGDPVADVKDIPHIVDGNGKFLSSRFYRAHDTSDPGFMPYYEEYKTEIKAQVERFIQIAGRKPAYFEGHATGSVAMGKALHDVAEEYDIFQLSREMNEKGRNNVYFAPLGEYAFDIFRNPDPYAQFHCDPIDYILKDGFHVLDKEYAIMMFHPGFVDADIMKVSTFHGVRIKDTEALCSQEFKNWICENSIRLINYYDLREALL